MNRSLKPGSLIKRRSTPIQVPSTIFKCLGLQEALGLKTNKIEMYQVPEPPVSEQYKQQKDFKEDEQPIEIDDICKEVEIEVGLLKNRKNIYRSRKDKKSSLSKPKIPPKSRITENSKLAMYFRNQLVSLFSVLGRRQDFISYLRGGSKVVLNNPPLKPFQIQEKLQKVIDSKGKDKARKNFNHLTNDQLRSLKYKPKPVHAPKRESKNKAQDEEEEPSQDGGEQDEDEDCQDMATWKRKNGVGFNQKVFIIKGGYQELRRTLLDKGWAENEEVRSPFFDLKWTTKICDIKYAELKNGQIVNHFNNNHHLTSKYGITRRLRSLAVSHNIDIDKFYPRCFDLGDQVQFQNFVENFKFCFAESIAKRFLFDKDRYKGLQMKIRIVLKIMRRHSLTLSERINKINNGEFLIIDPQEWEVITETGESTSPFYVSEKLKQLRNSDIYFSEGKSEQQYFNILHSQLQNELKKISQNQPQYCLNGHRNVWIAKPNFLSRGRGIRCFNNLYDIADYCLGRDCQFVIQKYIERPLLIQGRKFDIRQWVIIQDYSPPKIYFYQQCYLRFCMDDYSLDNIQNRFIHLTNNSIQKHNKKGKIDESMWEMEQFSNHIGKEKWACVKEKIKNIVVWSIKSCQNYVTSKKGSFETVGFDFMIDEELNPWLIQINMSPSMDSSTPVTKKLVKMLLHDTGLLISATKEKKKVGNFTCIYEQDGDLCKFDHYSHKG